MKYSIKQSTMALLTAAAFTLSACHTVQGVGKDLESAGDAAEDMTQEVTD